jgi:hypothetical protein
MSLGTLPVLLRQGRSPMANSIGFGNPTEVNNILKASTSGTREALLPRLRLQVHEGTANQLNDISWD